MPVVGRLSKEFYKEINQMALVNSVIADIQSIFKAGLKSYFDNHKNLNVNVLGDVDTSDVHY